jgi:hypothetical protein
LETKFYATPSTFFIPKEFDLHRLDDHSMRSPLSELISGNLHHATGEGRAELRIPLIVVSLLRPYRCQVASYDNGFDYAKPIANQLHVSIYYVFNHFMSIVILKKIW